MDNTDDRDMNNQDCIRLIEKLQNRVRITYETRIIAARRLREANECKKKFNIYISILVTTASVISMSCKEIFVQSIILACSIVLNYYMFYCNEMNLQERAYRMEETYKRLGELRNKIDIILKCEREKINKDKVTKIFKEYEELIENIENHKEVDYYQYIINNIDKEIDKREKIHDMKKSVKVFKRYNIIMNSLLYSISTLIFLCILYQIYFKKY